MALEIIGMYAAIAGGTEDAVANINVPQDGVLRGIDWDVYFDMDGDTEFAAVELSFVATNQVTTHDSRGRISSVGGIYSLTTSGAAFHTVQKWIGPVELMVFSGERIYLHVVSTSGVLGAIRCNLHFDGGATVPRRTARR
jgi:hypothetical protein